MTTLVRIHTQLNGFVGAPGVSTMYFVTALTSQDHVREFWTAVGPLMPGVVQATVDAVGDTISDTTGDINGTWNQGVANPQVASGGAAYAAPVGAVITWLTDGIVHSHRVRGRTFIVPLATSAYDNDGTLTLAAASALALAATNLWTATTADFKVWSRPFAGTAATATRPENPARAGSSHYVTGSRVSDKVAVLRSRRD